MNINNDKKKNAQDIRRLGGLFSEQKVEFQQLIYFSFTDKVLSGYPYFYPHFPSHITCIWSGQNDRVLEK